MSVIVAVCWTAKRGNILSLKIRCDQLKTSVELTRGFGGYLVKLAWSGYINNDEWAAINRRINEAFMSHIVAENSYSDCG